MSAHDEKVVAYIREIDVLLTFLDSPFLTAGISTKMMIDFVGFFFSILLARVWYSSRLTMYDASDLLESWHTLAQACLRPMLR